MKIFTTIFLALAAVLAACSERQTLEEKALHDAREFNRRYCPTPTINHIRTDSISFDIRSRTFTYHYSFCDLLDDADIVALNKDKITKMLQSNVKNSTSMKTYIESDYKFRIVCRSDQSPRTILLQLTGM